MTDTATAAPSIWSNVNWTALGADFAKIATAVAPFVPGASAAVLLTGQIVQGVLDAEPAAVALYNQLVSGAPVTAAELAAYQTGYAAADDKLKADIEAALAKLPPA